jgi:hypothetical protein
LEFGYQRPEFSTDTWTLEIRPIIDKQRGRWCWSLNPVLDWALKAQSANKGPDFSPSLKVSHDFTPLISGGIEYYGTWGPITGFDPWEEQQQQLFPVIDLNLGPEWELNRRVGFGRAATKQRWSGKKAGSGTDETGPGVRNVPRRSGRDG